MIKKFNLFEKYEDIDPYGEEDWGDDGFQIGDKLRCVKDVHTISGNRIIYIQGKDYFISNKDNNSVEIRSETGSRHSFLLSNINNWFVKSTNEGKLNESRISASLYDILGYLITKSAANIYITYQKIIHKSSDEEIAEYHDYCETLLDQMRSVTFLKNFLRNEGKPYSQSISLNKENREITDQKLSIMEELYDKIYYRDFKEDVKNVLKFYNDGYIKKVDLHTKNLLDVIKDTYNRNINEVDPYGEENWLEESKLNELIETNVGDFVIYDGNQLKNRKGKIAVITKDYGNGDFELKFEDGFIHSRCAKNLLKEADYRVPKKIEKPDVDPYSEEDWGWTKENVDHSDIIPEQKIIFEELLLQFGDYNLMVQWLNKNLKNKKVYFISTDDKIYKKNNTLHWFVENYEGTSRCPSVYVYMTNGECGLAKGLIYLDTEKINFPKKFKKIENPDLDPYGEEDWGWEEMKLEESAYNKKAIHKYDYVSFDYHGEKCYGLVYGFNKSGVIIMLKSRHKLNIKYDDLKKISSKKFFEEIRRCWKKTRYSIKKPSFKKKEEMKKDASNLSKERWWDTDE